MTGQMLGRDHTTGKRRAYWSVEAQAFARYVRSVIA